MTKYHARKLLDWALALLLGMVVGYVAGSSLAWQEAKEKCECKVTTKERP